MRVAIWKRALREGLASRRLLELAGNAPTVDDAVRKIVCALLDGVPVAPTQLEALKKPLKISEFCAEDVPFSGELRRDGKQLKVVYSVHLSESRRRFTIAHEMGHAILEKANRNCGQSGSEVERLCDKLAAEILMPHDIFMEKLGADISIKHIFELKTIFGVSLLSVARRCFEFCRASIFEIEDGQVKWGSGLVKRGAIQTMDSGLQINVQSALEDLAGRIAVYFDDQGVTREGELEWLKVSSNRTIFLLTRNDVRLSTTKRRAFHT